MSSCLAAAIIQSAAEFSTPVLLGAVGLALFRALRGPDAVDRVLALDLISMLAVGVLALRGIAQQEIAYVEVATVVVLVVFLATVGFARYMTRQQDENGQER